VILDARAGVGLHRGNGRSVIVNSEYSFVQSPWQSVEVITQPDFEALFLRISHDGFVHELQKMLERDVHTPLVFSPEFQMESVAGHRLRELTGGLGYVLGTASDRDVRTSLSLRELESQIIALLLQAQPHNYTRLLSRCTSAGDWQIAAAEEYMRANAHLPLSLGDICQAAGVNARTLQYSFRKKRGYRPMQFLRVVRMEEVHAGLSRPEDHTTVTNEAARWGFVHFGRFSREYRLTFGELPSETLRRAKGRSGADGAFAKENGHPQVAALTTNFA
jgi:AraC-like DNA-binding protein